jgi:hypothetical protein
MRKQEETETTLIGVSYQPTFAFKFVGGILSHDKRLFETLHYQLSNWFLLLSETEDFDDRDERLSCLQTLAVLDELASSTRSLSDKQLQKQFTQVLQEIGCQKESEATNV